MEIEPFAGPDGRRPHPSLDTARNLFAAYGASRSSSETELRRIYLRLALWHHPDKQPSSQRDPSTKLFQAISAVYEELSRPFGRLVKRVKTPAAAAAELGALEELERLLADLPARANEEDDLGVTPLMFAAKGGSVAAAALLLRHGADLHAETPIGWTAVLWAGLNGQEHMVRWLLEQGARVRERDLVLVAYAGSPGSLAALLDCFEGSAAELRSQPSGQTLLHLTCLGICHLGRGDPERYLAGAELLLARGVPVDAREGRRGRTALQSYVAHPNWHRRRLEDSPPHLALVRRLLERGASARALDAEGHSALSLAEQAGLRRVLAILAATEGGIDASARL